MSQSVASIEQRTRPNLSKTLKGEVLYLLNVFPSNDFEYDVSLLFWTCCCFLSDLGLTDGQELAVADATSPQTMLFRLRFTS